MQKKISVIVATKDRPEKLIKFIISLLKNNYQKYELIIIDQSINKEKSSQIKSIFKSKKHKYVYNKNIGKSLGLNYGIKLSTGEILAFTDDDCMVQKNWLKYINQSFQNEKIDLVFGRTLPYKKTKKNGYFCPSTFNKKKPSIISTVKLHWKHIGIGNNMSIKSKNISELSGFKEWLGPGTFAGPAEDAEITIRSIISGKIIYFNPRIVVWHNRWLAPNEYNKLEKIYNRSEIITYMFLGLKGSHKSRDILKKIIFFRIKNILSESRDPINLIFKLIIETIQNTFYLFFSLSKIYQEKYNFFTKTKVLQLFSRII